MLRGFNALRHYTVGAADGDIGTIDDLLYDNDMWTAQRLVIDTGRWLPGRKSLLPAAALGRPAWPSERIPTVLTKEQVRRRESPHPAIRQDQRHLRSAKATIGYRIEAADGPLGGVADFILDDEAWLVRYLVVDTGSWLPGKRVLLSPQWVDEISWAERQVRVNLEREKIRRSPEYDPAVPMRREYEGRLHDYYGRPRYWERPFII